MSGETVIGWDIGGAHVKAARLTDGLLNDAVQWPCPLWRGISQLQDVLIQAEARWPGLHSVRHAVTMSGEMVDLFEHRQAGVQGIAEALAPALPRSIFFAGPGDWCRAEMARLRWADIASANWLAAAAHTAAALPDNEGLWVDIGSTTTDLIAFKNGRAMAAGRHDAERLANGELVYQGVSRTPLCALGPRIAWRGRKHNVMNEFFATTADVYRLTGQLDPAHDQYPSADGADKDDVHTQARLARMIGLDARDGSADEWRSFAATWSSAQQRLIRAQVRQVVALHRLGSSSVVVASGCGAFLVPRLVDASWCCLPWGEHVARLAAGTPKELSRWAEVCAPAVAVAALAAGAAD